MSVKHLVPHHVRETDTVETVVAQYRLSSWKAIYDIPANQAIRPRLPDSGSLPVGLVILIPPNAIYLAKERIYALNEIRPLVVGHFDSIRDVLDSELRPALENARNPGDSEDVDDLLFSLHKKASNDISTIAARAMKLVGISIAMCHTHVADTDDFKARNCAMESLCGLYWMISPGAHDVWQRMWVRSMWVDRWRVGTIEPFVDTSRYVTTVRSIVTQAIDGRLREAQALELRLRTEG